MNPKIIYTVLIILSLRATCLAQLFIKPGDRHISYMGRVLSSKDSVSFYWPGTTALINFRGSAVKIRMRSKKESGYFYAIVDHDTTRILKFKVDTLQNSITVASDLKKGRHHLEIYKITNCTSENIFYGLEIEGKAAILEPDKLPTRKIEFYGNSITAGHGVDGSPGSKDSGSPEYYNNYYAYDALTARHFNAQHSIIARGGIGVMVSWFPEIMPETYDRLNPLKPNSKWDFKKFKPDVVVIDLFQNDSWLVNMPNHPQFKARFGKTKPTDEFIVNAYYDFVKALRNKYPAAKIICTLGNMDATQKD